MPTAIEKGVWLGETVQWDSKRRERLTSHMVIAHRDPDGHVRRFSGVMRDISSEHEARKASEVVATVGMIEALPGAVNVIPGEAGFSIDLRSPVDETRHRAVAAVSGDHPREPAWPMPPPNRL